MSVERVQRKNGAVWRVRWRENGQPHSRVLGSKRDADLFEADIKRRKRLGQLAQIDAGRQTVAQFAREWWCIHAEPNLATRTRETYAAVFDKHILPPRRRARPARRHARSRGQPERRHAGGGGRARGNPQGADGAAENLLLRCALGARLEQAGRRGAQAQRQAPARCHTAVAGCCRAHAWRAARGRPASGRDARVGPRVRRAAPAGGTRVPWSNVRGRTLLIDRAQSDEGLKDTKTDGTRSVRLLAPLAATWRHGALPAARSSARRSSSRRAMENGGAITTGRTGDAATRSRPPPACPECVRMTCAMRSARC